MSSDTDLHIISFDVPFPPDYGGVIDVFYKIRALKEEGLRIALHCFEYGRSEAEALKELCSKVYYYPRQTTKSYLFNTLPYIVLSRQSDNLKKNLLSDIAPVLMEGLHTTYLLPDPDLGGRRKIVRMHNIEHEYYENLARVERNIFKRYYFYNEAGKLKKYESVLKHADVIASISPNDRAYYSSRFNVVEYIPAFHPFEVVSILPGKSDFAFYHGNLSVGENNEAALYLVNTIFRNSAHKLVIAGSKPSAELIKAVKANPSVQLLSDRTPAQIYELVREAQCNILPTFQSTGIKLKLLAALFTGRHCIVNTPMVEGTGLDALCIVADTPEEMKIRLDEAMASDALPPDMLEKRKEFLSRDFSNRTNAKKLIGLIGLRS
jgi:glycosyltransferase involved in cell wall biosynthesis